MVPLSYQEIYRDQRIQFIANMIARYGLEFVRDCPKADKELLPEAIELYNKRSEEIDYREMVD